MTGRNGSKLDIFAPLYQYMIVIVGKVRQVKLKKNLDGEIRYFQIF